MSPPPDRSPRLAGGMFLSLAVLIGAVIGVIDGQPTIGLLAGLSAGIIFAVAIWLIDRRR